MVVTIKQHTINSLLDKYHSKRAKPYHRATSQLIAKQQSKIKSPIVEINNYLNEVYSFFDSLNKESFLGFHLVDSFLNCFLFLTANQKDSELLIAHWNKLDNIYEDSLFKQDLVLIIVNTSIKNNIATLISHTCREQETIVKIMYYKISVSSTKAETFCYQIWD